MFLNVFESHKIHQEIFITIRVFWMLSGYHGYSIDEFDMLDPMRMIIMHDSALTNAHVI